MVAGFLFLILLISLLIVSRNVIEPFKAASGMEFLAGVLSANPAMKEMLYDKFEDFDYVQNTGKGDTKDERLRQIFYEEDKNNIAIIAKRLTKIPSPEPSFLAMPSFTRSYTQNVKQDRLVMIISKRRVDAESLAEFLEALGDMKQNSRDIVGDMNVSGTVSARKILQDGEEFLLKNGDTLMGDLVVSQNMAIGIKNTTSSKLTIGGNVDQFPSSLYLQETTHSTSTRAGIAIGKWAILQDINGTGERDFSIYRDAYENNPAANVLNITSDLRVGINTTKPTAGLHVASIPTFTGSGNQLLRDMFKVQPDGNNSTYTEDVVNKVSCSIYSEGRVIIGSADLLVYSDARTKRVIDEPVSALTILNKLDPIMYEYNDSKIKQTGKKYGVLAQQVAEVFPQAVTQRADYICDICKLITVENDTITCKDHGLQIGDKIKLLRDNFTDLYAIVTAADQDRFKVNIADLTDVCFLYGKHVDDVMAVDYQQLFCLGLKAIKELKSLLDVYRKCALLQA